MTSHNMLVVTRHPALIKYLEQQGIIPAGSRRIIHATRQNVEGKNVVGTLPNYLACYAKSLTEVPLNIPASLRGVELTVDHINQFAMPITTYKISQSPFQSKQERE